MLKVKLYSTTNNAVPSTLIAEYNISEVEIFRSMVETTTFSFSIDIKQIDNSFPAEVEKLIYCEVIRNGITVVQGIIGTFEKNKDTIKVECEDVLYLLTSKAARPHVMYRNRHVVAILNDLLENHPVHDAGGNFKLKDFSTLPSPVAITTIDLRDEEILYSQINKLLDNNEDFYIRYGGYGEVPYEPGVSYHFYDLGLFNNNLHYRYDNSNISDLEVEANDEKKIGYIVAYGGTYTDSLGDIQILDLSTINYFGGYPASLNPNYGISGQINPDYDWVYDINEVADNSFLEMIVKYYDVSVTTDTVPTNDELGDYSYQLYKSAVKDFKKRKRSEKIVTFESTDIPDYVMPGNIIQVNYKVTNQRYRLMADMPEYKEVENFSLEGNFYIESYKLSYSETKGNKIKYTLNTTGNYDDTKAEKIRINIKKEARKNKEYFIIPTIYKYGYYELIEGGGNAANSTIGGNPALEVTMFKLADADFGDLGNPPGPPGNSTVVAAYYACSEDPTLVIEWSDPPVAGDLTFKFKIQRNDSWDVTQTAVVKILVAFDY